MKFLSFVSLLVVATFCCQPHQTRVVAGNESLHSTQSIHTMANGGDQSRGLVDLNDQIGMLQRSRRQPPAGKRAVFYSEQKLRTVVQIINYDLRQLKRDFLAQMTDIYLAIKMDPQNGFPQAKKLQTEVANANMLLAAEFADIAIKKFIIQRRLLTGLKMAFVRFMPMDSLVRLYKRYDSFAWLRYQSQCEIRKRLPADTRDEQVETIYGLIEARARARAADDVIALTADNMQRILQVVQTILIESRHSRNVKKAELEQLALQAKNLLNFYLNDVVEWANKLRKEHVRKRHLARPLFDQFGGKKKFIRFIDELINTEALDIDLNKESRKLALPPTINKQIIINLAEKWIPSYVLKSLEEDRGMLLENRKLVLQFVKLDEEKQDVDFAEWSSNVLNYLCRNSAVDVFY